MKIFKNIYYILDMQVIRYQRNHIIYVIQKKYLKNIVKRFGIEDCKSLIILLDSNRKLSKDMSLQTHEKIKAIEDISYQSVIDSLVYVMIGT